MNLFKRLFTGSVIFLIIVLIAGIIYVLQFQEESSVIKEPKTETQKVITPKKEKEKQKTIIAKTEKASLPLKQVAIIIDDIGYDLKPVKELLKINADLTFAVLPFCAHTREVAAMLHRAHRETLLHLPMEPVDYPREKPGDGALFIDMNDEELLFQLEKDIASVPYISGVNNHMGSKFMMDEKKLALIFKRLKKRKMFFIDSRTSADTKAFVAAEKMGLPFSERKVFLDNNQDYNEIYNNLINITKNNGDIFPMIIIGHPHPETIRAISDAIKVLREKGISVVPASQIIKVKTSH